MRENLMKHSSAWVTFSYVSFGFSAFMLIIGLYMMPIDLWGKGYLTMGILMLVQTTVNVTKTLRDNQEADKLIRRVDDARTEKLILGIKGESDS
ncbi:hypothetical protein TH25_19735 [Thalassospira profundimaris]|uniref:YiaAB two helix domain-containing protein n=1 Tax=Thalassospira profundimaris TaxID=502049 RepID=A0A367WSP4_9PROT|nr:YiaA/YiaB family inner membrane protein [Thalassospira profundimaris]RCK44486.1 hypothetical protein TH25_19735 [Thalassospira profundimaris]